MKACARPGQVAAAEHLSHGPWKKFTPAEDLTDCCIAPYGTGVACSNRDVLIVVYSTGKGYLVRCGARVWGEGVAQ